MQIKWENMSGWLFLDAIHITVKYFILKIDKVVLKVNLFIILFLDWINSELAETNWWQNWLWLTHGS